MAKNLRKHPLERWAETCVQQTDKNRDSFVQLLVDDTLARMLAGEGTFSIGTVAELALIASLTKGEGHIVHIAPELADDIMSTEPSDESAKDMLAGRLPWPIFAIETAKDEDYQAIIVTTRTYLRDSLDDVWEALDLSDGPTKETLAKRLEAEVADRDIAEVAFGLVPSQRLLERQAAVLAERTIEEMAEKGLDAVIDGRVVSVDQARQSTNTEALVRRMAHVPFDYHLVDTTLPGHTDDAMPTMALIVFVCAKNSTMRTTHEPGPEPKGSAKRRRRSRATWHECGFEWTEAYREYRRAKSQSRALGGSVRPHVRRAHWHHFWTGPRDGERELVCHWIPPTLVKGRLGKQTNQGHIIT